MSLKEEVNYASILREVPYKERDEGSEEHNDEEWEVSNSGDMSYMWDQDVPNRKGLRLIFWESRLLEGLDIPSNCLSSNRVLAY